ncbi:MAG: hypothetical protein EBQ92_08590 [Proteobacteria bacterium]|nr:hypothetical protein [Pseudomonadota bacterium]
MQLTKKEHTGGANHTQQGGPQATHRNGGLGRLRHAAGTHWVPALLVGLEHDAQVAGGVRVPARVRGKVLRETVLPPVVAVGAHPRGDAVTDLPKQQFTVLTHVIVQVSEVQLCDTLGLALEGSGGDGTSGGHGWAVGLWTKIGRG